MHAHAGLNHRTAAVLAVDQHGMVGRDRADDFRPGDRAGAALLNAAANGFQHHLARQCW